MKTNIHYRVALALIASAIGSQQALAQMAMPTMAPPGSAPHYFSVGNYANSPLPTVSGTMIAGGNPLIARQFATDYAKPPGELAPVLVVVPQPLPQGLVQGFKIYNQATPGGSPNPSAGNVLRPYTSVKLSLRLPPTLDG